MSLLFPGRWDYCWLVSLITEGPTVTATVATATSPYPTKRQAGQALMPLFHSHFNAETLAYRSSTR
ncbi:unnamed protein product [Clonostachys byssicola]|uniref:Uncharacterized protein n=1 Tax=Clonostachys byssicola TaxID=160290 RepID=A0A9N9UUG2_9HYPO|nr:unnamed protein product [Clonostachys byssicola]